MVIRFVGVIIAVVGGMFIYNNYIDNTDSKKLVNGIMNNNAIADNKKSTQQNFEEFKAQRLKEFDEFKKGNF